MPGDTIKDCLTTIDIGLAGLGDSASLGQEWAFIKKGYFKKILVCHPDKGGDARVFRDVQAAFEVLRKLFEESAIESFVAAQAQSTADSYKGTKEDFKDMSSPSWEYYAEAAKEVSASYRVELARSNRSRCQARGSKKKCDQALPFIEKGALRVGFILESGGYGLWVHLECWRVPSKIWLGLPDPATCPDRRAYEKALLRLDEVSLCGLGDLAAAERKKVVRYVMDKKHWTFSGVAEKVRKKPAAAAANEDDGGTTSGAQSADLVLPLALKPKERERFVIPVPGRGAPAGSLTGLTFVLTGLFPEIGGGEGLSLGKDRAKKMITSFGGKVASAVSGRTNVLVVGKEPGFSKVAKARKSAKARLLSLREVKVGLERGSLEDAGTKAKPMLIRSFSKGYSQRRGGPNSLALSASKEELAIASGTKAVKQGPKAVKQGPKAIKAGSAARKRPAAAPEAAAKKRKLSLS